MLSESVQAVVAPVPLEPPPLTAPEVPALPTLPAAPSGPLPADGASWLLMTAVQPTLVAKPHAASSTVAPRVSPECPLGARAPLRIAWFTELSAWADRETSMFGITSQRLERSHVDQKFRSARLRSA